MEEVQCIEIKIEIKTVIVQNLTLLSYVINQKTLIACLTGLTENRSLESRK